MRANWFALIFFGVKLNIKDVLAIGGIIVGLPSFIGLFVQGHYVLAIFVIIFVSTLVFYYWDAHLQKDYTVLSRESTLRILDERGERAVSEKKLKIRSNHRGLSQYVHRNISSDGDMIFSTDHGTLDIRRSAGDYTVTHRFPNPLRKWQKIDLKLIQQFDNSFTQNTEGVIIWSDYKTKKATVKVILPETRPCTTARMICREGSDEKILGEPHISPNRQEISWNIKRLKVGTEYEIEWDW